jgi:hypothetical protein
MACPYVPECIPWREAGIERGILKGGALLIAECRLFVLLIEQGRGIGKVNATFTECNDLGQCPADAGQGPRGVR